MLDSYSSLPTITSPGATAEVEQFFNYSNKILTLLVMFQLYPRQRIKSTWNLGALDMTQNYIWWWGSSNWDWDGCAVILRLTRLQSGTICQVPIYLSIRSIWKKLSSKGQYVKLKLYKEYKLERTMNTISSPPQG